MQHRVRKVWASLTTAAVALLSATRLNVLIVDDELHIRRLCSEVASQIGMKVTAVDSAEEALEVLGHSPMDILLTDLRLRESAADGLELIRQVRQTNREIAIIAMTGYGSIDSAVTATRLGAVDYITKPFRIEELRSRIERAASTVALQHDNYLLREQLRNKPGFGGLIGLSLKMQTVYKMTERVSPHEYPVLILGETGTGKEMVARSIHFAGPRKDRPFVPVDCSALVPTLIESELFGHTRGAFTGAVELKRGLFESAEGGTLFLDEIGDMPVELQGRLLRALQEREIRAVGSTETKKINVRIIAATHRDLRAAIRTGTFRQDLYFRINVVQMKLPALRERKGDIPLLVTSFLEKFSAIHGSTRTISARAMDSLIAYDWPGNVRELENAIESAVALSTDHVLEAGDLSTNLHCPSGRRFLSPDENFPLEQLERRAILRTLRETAGDKIVTARLLGIGKTTLYRKLRQYEATGSGA